MKHDNSGMNAAYVQKELRVKIAMLSADTVHRSTLEGVQRKHGFTKWGEMISPPNAEPVKAKCLEDHLEAKCTENKT